MTANSQTSSTIIIDCDTDPMVPDGWSVEEHQKGGSLEWTPDKVALYVSEQQKGDKLIEGNKLRKELKGKPVFNVCLLDYLLAHPHLIPEEWKSKAIFFWGTIYRHSDGNLRVPCLLRYGDRWDCMYCGLGRNFRNFDPDAVSASN